MPDTPGRPTFAPALVYTDPLAALDWLETAFGFERSMVITDKEGRLAHSEMTLGNGRVMVGGAWAEFLASPATIGGRNTQSIHVHLTSDVDAHCERARRAGAEILMEPSDQFYGDRAYRARDPEGHVWSFAQTVRAVSREEAELASELAIEGWI